MTYVILATSYRYSAHWWKWTSCCWKPAVPLAPLAAVCL